MSSHKVTMYSAEATKLSYHKGKLQSSGGDWRALYHLILERFPDKCLQRGFVSAQVRIRLTTLGTDLRVFPVHIPCAPKA